MPKDYYHILGVEKSATDQEIKKAYRALAKNLHPDLNTSSQAALDFHEINEAYVVLSDAKKRTAYDNGRTFHEPRYTEEELREIEKRQRHPFTRDYQFQSRNQYPPTDYKANEKVATLLNMLAMCFALTLIIDFFVSRPIGDFEVQSVTQMMLVTGNISDADKYILSTEKAALIVDRQTLNQLNGAPEMAQLRKSLLYGNLSFRLEPEMSLVRNQRFVLVTYLFVFIVFIAGSTGVYPKLSSERKFNAAVVSTFFSFVIGALLFIG